jgi:hypothetical protein
MYINSSDVDEEDHFMNDEQHVIPPAPMVRLPQIPPQQVATRRQKYACDTATRLYFIPTIRDSAAGYATGYITEFPGSANIFPQE